MFFFKRSSEDRDQLASVSKSLVTTLLALPNEKSFEAAVMPTPIQIELLLLLALTSASSPIQTLEPPVVIVLPDDSPIAVLRPPEVSAPAAPIPTAVLLCPP